MSLCINGDVTQLYCQAISPM